MSTRACVILAVVWLCAVAIVSGWLVVRSTSAGPRQAGPDSWPATILGPQSSDRLSIVVALHPKCPCSKATITQLSELARALGDTAEFVALLLVPSGMDADWMHSNTRDQLATLPSCRVILDHRGEAARALGMRTSGHVQAFSPDGSLVFSGGVTPSRGDLGPCAPLEVLSALASRPAEGNGPPAAAPVFGCQLFDEPDAPLAEQPAQ